MTKEITELIKLLQNEKHIYIQTHNYPDHDAVASAFALQGFFKNFGIKFFLTFDGDIQRDSLMDMISFLSIDIKHISEYDMKAEDKIVIVDGCTMPEYAQTSCLLHKLNLHALNAVRKHSWGETGMTNP